MDRAVLELPNPFYLFRLLTGSDHLHFGYFRSPRESVGEAQENMMWLNLFFRRRDATRVLDVGSGLGATARELAKQGCRVTAVCPDATLIAYGRAREAAAPSGPPVEWITSAFEAWKPTDSFDHVMFQESFQYFDHVEATLRHTRGLLRDGGRVVIGDQFLNERRPREAVRFHFVDDFVAAARDVGFRIATSCDISAGALVMTRRMLEQLRAEKDALIAAHEPAKPAIRKDIDEMLYWGSQELGAFDHGLLSYRTFVLDA